MERSEYIQRETKKATCIFISKQNQEQNPIYVKHLEMIITQAKKKVKIMSEKEKYLSWLPEKPSIT